MTTSIHTPRLLIPSLAPLHEVAAPLAAPLVRVAAGLLLMPHGAQKLLGWFAGSGTTDSPGQFIATTATMATGQTLAIGLIELIGGLLLAIGLFTRPVAALIAGMMAVAVFQILPANGFFWNQGGYEYPLMWGVIALAFALRGGGRYSTDAMIGREI